MKRSLLLAWVLLTLAICSCSDKDGDWAPMKWKTNATSQKTTKDPQIDVAPNGGDYTFTCTNYSSFWIENVLIDDETVWTSTDWTIQNSRTEVTTDIATIQSIGNQLKVSVNPNTSNDKHTIAIMIESGDIFSTVTLTQPAANHQ